MVDRAASRGRIASFERLKARLDNVSDRARAMSTVSDMGIPNQVKDTSDVKERTRSANESWMVSQSWGPSCD